MINLVRVEDINSNRQIGDYEYCYKLMKDNQGIGYGTINKDKENQLFIFIDKQERGNGYGKILFSKMIEETKNIGYQEVNIEFQKENIPMLKIADDNGGIQTSAEGDSFKYVIPIR